MKQDSVTHKGSMIIDATACPQNIAYPTDLDILNSSRMKSEELLDVVFQHPAIRSTKPRNYRKKARKDYLRTAQKKQKSKKEIRRAIGKQLGYLARNIRSINRLLDECGEIPFEKGQYKYWLVIQHAYQQQSSMYHARSHSIEHRIVSIHQPHVRPIVRGKSQAKVEFGAKINVSLVDGFTMIGDMEWKAYNEGTRLKTSVEEYKRTYGYYPEYVLADKIYCNRQKRTYLKDIGITLKAKPLGRPSALASQNRVSSGERNPIEGKFGQAKTGYAMNLILARLARTSETWISCIVLVLNLVKLAELALYCIINIIINYVVDLRKNGNLISQYSKIC